MSCGLKVRQAYAPNEISSHAGQGLASRSLLNCRDNRAAVSGIAALLLRLFHQGSGGKQPEDELRELTTSFFVASTAAPPEHFWATDWVGTPPGGAAILLLS